MGKRGKEREGKEREREESMNQQQNLFYSYLPQGQPQGKLQVVLCAIEFQMYQQVEAGNETYAKQITIKQIIYSTHILA